MKTVRRLCASLAAITLLLALAAGLAWWSIHTAWFANLVRSRIVSALQKSTGGRVELGAFRFNPDSLHAKVSRLVIHGTEHPGSPALLSVESIDVGLKILSVWHQDVNVQSVTINQPQFHLTVKEDGSTNFPTSTTRRFPFLSVRKTPACTWIISLPGPVMAFLSIRELSPAPCSRSRSGRSEFGPEHASTGIAPMWKVFS
jgi:uncharacterized protein involved in outer membrane biogenesis